MVTRASLSRRCLFVFVFFSVLCLFFSSRGLFVYFFIPLLFILYFYPSFFPSEHVICSRLEERLSLW